MNRYTLAEVIIKSLPRRASLGYADLLLRHTLTRLPVEILSFGAILLDAANPAILGTGTLLADITSAIAAKARDESATILRAVA
jgi:hypothetical protein